MRFLASVTLAWALLLGAGQTASADKSAASSDRLPIVYVEEPPAEGGGDQISRIIYLNRCADGCTIYPGERSDARANTSSIPDEESFIQPFAHGDERWNEVVACVQELYAPYNVTVTDVDPGPEVIHHEAIVAGRPQDIGRSGIGGVAPGGGCAPQNNVISFTFANTYSSSRPLTICSVVGQETAHAFGLDHAFDCSDPMTYLGACGQQFFRNKMMPCGEFAERPCDCTGLTQNSHVTLLSVFGPGTPPPPPELEIQIPAEGATVEDQFSIRATANDKRGVHKLELYINGWYYAEVPGHEYPNRGNPYGFVAPAGIPDGVLHVEIRASNDLESTTVKTVTVTKGAPCTTEATCLDGQFCDDGACTWPEPVAELGDECVRNEDCISRTCASDGNQDLCTESCFTGVNDFCPTGFECIQAGAQGVCWPAGAETDDPKGCCSVGDSGIPSGGQLLLTGLVALVLVRRRRSRDA